MFFNVFSHLVVCSVLFYYDNVLLRPCLWLDIDVSNAHCCWFLKWLEDIAHLRPTQQTLRLISIMSVILQGNAACHDDTVRLSEKLKLTTMRDIGKGRTYFATRRSSKTHRDPMVSHNLWLLRSKTRLFDGNWDSLGYFHICRRFTNQIQVIHHLNYICIRFYAARFTNSPISSGDNKDSFGGAKFRFDRNLSRLITSTKACLDFDTYTTIILVAVLLVINFHHFRNMGARKIPKSQTRWDRWRANIDGIQGRLCSWSGWTINSNWYGWRCCLEDFD